MFRPFCLAPLLLLSCTGKDDDSPSGEADADTDADTDVDAEQIVTYTVETVALDTLDVSLQISTFPDMEGHLDALRLAFAEVLPEVTPLFGSTTYSVVTFLDYGNNLPPPFRSEIQQTDDLDAVQTALDDVLLYDESAHAAPSSPGNTGTAIEALYQTFRGSGYDQNCDATYEVGYTNHDILPFHASTSDPFGGKAGEGYDPTVPGTGTEGGVGLREDARLRVVFTFTNHYLRDADDPELYDLPGGCPRDAGFSDVLDVIPPATFLVGMSNYPFLGTTQMELLAEASGALADLDGDKKPDPLVFESTDVWKPEVETAENMVTALQAIKLIAPPIGSVVLEVRDDPYGLVRLVTPDEHTNVSPALSDYLSFAAKYDWSGVEDGVDESTVTFMVVADGVDVYPMTEVLRRGEKK